MRTPIKGIFSALLLIVGIVLVVTGPASAEEPEDEGQQQVKHDDSIEYGSYTVCHYKQATFPYWATLVLSSSDTAWHLQNHGSDYKTQDGCPQNDPVKICKQVDGYWKTVWLDPDSANWLLHTGQGRLVEDCNKPEPTPEPTPQPTPTEIPEQPEQPEQPVTQPTVTPEQPVVEEKVDETKDVKVVETPQTKSSSQALNETVTRSELALTGTSSTELAGYALMLLGAGVALSLGADRLRRATA